MKILNDIRGINKHLKSVKWHSNQPDNINKFSYCSTNGSRSNGSPYIDRDAAPMSARMPLSVCSDGRYTVGSEELFLSFTIPRLLAIRLRGVAAFFNTLWENTHVHFIHRETPSYENKESIIHSALGTSSLEFKTTDIDDTLTNFFLDLVLLTLRFFLLTPVPATLPFLPTAEDVFFLLTFRRFPV